MTSSNKVKNIYSYIYITEKGAKVTRHDHVICCTVQLPILQGHKLSR